MIPWSGMLTKGNIVWVLERTGLSQRELALLLQTSRTAISQVVRANSPRQPADRWEPWILQLTAWVQDCEAEGYDAADMVSEALFDWEGGPVEGWLALAAVFDPNSPELVEPAPLPKADRHIRHFIKLLNPDSGAAVGERKFAYKRLAAFFDS